MAVFTGSYVPTSSVYSVYIYTSSGIFTPSFTGNVEILVVAGGGGGGMDLAGGGGGGGVISNTSYAVTAGVPITVTVGAGGYGAPAGSGGYRTDGSGPQPGGHQFTISATNGNNSVFGSSTAIGGGYGGSSYFGYTPNYGYGNSGGSGGGASGYSDGNTGRGGAGTAGQGYAGGGSAGQYYPGGGGGAGGAGSTNPANGGPGVLNQILDIPYYWGGGGAGCGHSGSAGTGGIGGGGGAPPYSGPGTAGGVGFNSGQSGGYGYSNSPGAPGGAGGQNTGGGGGGGTHYNNNNKGGEGGSGIVIVKHLSSLGVGSGSVGANPRSLILALDSNNRKSNFLNTNNSIDFTVWTPGTNTTTWPSNGDGNQNSLIYDTDPWGNSSLVLKTIPNNGGANGGWEGCAPGYWVSADKNKKYRSSVWVRRISSNTNGTFYHGLHSDGSGDVIQSDGSTNGNPYWACQGIGYLTQNQWYLHVGHMFPYNSTPQVDPTSGYWTRPGNYIGNPGCNITGSDPRFPSNATLIRNRVYHYYASSDSNSNIELAWPRIDVCDGTEPTIDQILNTPPTAWNNPGGAPAVMQGNISWAPTTGFSNFTGNSTGSGNKFLVSSFPQNLKTSQGGQGYTVMALARSTGGTGAWRKLVGNWDGDNYIDLYQSPSGYWHQDGSGESLYYNAGISVANDSLYIADSVWRVLWATNLNSGTLTNPTYGLSIGNEPHTNAYPWVGNIAAVYLYNRVLSTTEMAQVFSSIRNRYNL